jgi:hypothetical protein
MAMSGKDWKSLIKRIFAYLLRLFGIRSPNNRHQIDRSEQDTANDESVK